jgi:hypothetical protein
MNEVEQIEILADTQRQINAHWNEIIRLDNEVMRLHLLKAQFIEGRIDQRLLVSKRPKTTDLPQDRNGRTSDSDAIRLCIPSMPETFKIKELREMVRSRFPHAVTSKMNFRQSFYYVRTLDPSIIRLQGTDCYKRKGIMA